MRRDLSKNLPVERRVDMGAFSRSGDLKVHPNEDRAVVLQSIMTPDQITEDASDSSNGSLDLNEVSYLAVFDGHCGQECAQFMANHLHEHIVNFARSASCNSFQDLKFILGDAFKAADEEFSMLHDKSIAGSCGVVALIHGSEILIAHVGDCRAVLRCNNVTTKLTRDHRPSDPEELKRVTSLGGTVVNGRVGGVMTPTRAFGDMDVRAEWGDGIIISEPDITYATLEREEDSRMPSGMAESRFPSGMSASSTSSTSSSPCFLLLTSDGVCDDMSYEDACKIVESSLRRSPNNSTRAAEKLVRAASSKTSDDCTVAVAVWCGPEPATPSRVMSRRFDLPLSSSDMSVPPSPTSSM